MAHWCDDNDKVTVQIYMENIKKESINDFIK